MTTIPVNLSAIVDGAQINTTDVLTPIADLKAAIDGSIDGTIDFQATAWTDPVTIALASDVLIPTQTRVLVETEGGAGSDNLATVTNSGVHMVILQLATPGRTITVKHGTGNIYLEGKRDYVLSSTSQLLILWARPTNLWGGVAVNANNVFMDDSVDATIASDAIVATRSKLRLIPQAGVTDDLATITNSSNLGLVVICPKNGTDTITIKHNTGNIFLASGADYVMANQNQALVLIWDDTNSKWTNVQAVGPTNLNYQTNYGVQGQVTSLAIHKDGLITELGSGKVLFDYVTRWGRRRRQLSMVATGTTSIGYGGMGGGGTVVNSDQSYRRFIQSTSGVVLNNVCDFKQNSPRMAFRWSPYLCAVAAGFDNGSQGANGGYFIGFFDANPTYSAGPVISMVGRTLVCIRPYASGGTLYAGEVWDNGTLRGQVFFGVNPLNSLASGPENIFRVWIDGVVEACFFEVNGERASLTGFTVTAGLRTTLMYGGCMGVCNVAGVAKVIQLSTIEAESD